MIFCGELKTLPCRGGKPTACLSWQWDRSRPTERLSASDASVVIGEIARGGGGAFVFALFLSHLRSVVSGTRKEDVYGGRDQELHDDASMLDNSDFTKLEDHLHPC